MSCKEVKQLIERIRHIVIEWEKRNWVPYPWRVNRDPYKVLIAELLLKRTTRQAVLREFHEFLQKFPCFYAIYSAQLDEIERALKHLGLYRQRAQHLKKISEVILTKYNGRIPDRWEELEKLPGVGSYLAGAVLSFGYGKRAPVIDSNVIRLLSRMTGITVKNRKDFLRLLWRLVPERGHELFNYGLIDLGASVCHYRRPRCGVCPLKELCVYYVKREDVERAERIKQLYVKVTYGKKA